MKFTETHEWISEENGVATIGISDFAQKELGDVVFVELPPLGKKVETGSEVAVLESTKAASDVYAPLSGEVLEVNELLKDHPELINTSPFSEGWIYKCRIANPEDLFTLMSQEEYREKHR